MKYFTLVFMINLSYASLGHFKALGTGGMDGGGNGSEFPESGSAWFYQDYEKGFIDICYEKSESFKATDNEVRESILMAFKTWKNYIQKHDLYALNSERPISKRLRILTDIKIKNCHKDTDVKFYFGVVNKDVQRVLNRLVKARGFAYRGFNDINTLKGFSKGIVWVFDPTDKQQRVGPNDRNIFDWTMTEKLEGMIIHEVGHILGVPHIPGTIMRHNLLFLFTLVREVGPILIGPNYREYLTKIDQEKRLLYSFDQYESQVGSVALPGKKEEKVIFKKLMGRDLSGEAKIQFTIHDLNVDFKIWDEIGEKTFSVKRTKEEISSIGFDQKVIFKRVRPSVRHPYGSSEYAYIYPKKGVITLPFYFKDEKHFLELILNMDSTIYPLEGKQYMSNSELIVFLTDSKGVRKPLYIKWGLLKISLFVYP